MKKLVYTVSPLGVQFLLLLIAAVFHMSEIKVLTLVCRMFYLFFLQ